MKTLLLSALFLGTVFTAAAQTGGYSVSPLGATPDQEITITIDPNVVCVDGTAGLSGSTQVRLHSGVNINGQRWQSVQSASPAADGGLPNAVVGFTQNPNGTWSKSFTPRSYYNVPAGTDIAEICFVLNGGPDGTNWDLRGKYDDGTGTCGDGFIPFPIAAPWGVTSVKKGVNTAFTVRNAYPNPATSEAKVNITLKQSGNVAVTVKNVLGQTVAVLANGFEVAGEKSFTWNTQNAPAGMYFFTVESAGNTASTRINVVK